MAKPKRARGKKPLTRRQQFRIEKKKVKLEKLKARKSVRLERVKAKGASGFWSPDAVKARQETVQKGIAAGTELAGDVAGALSSVYGGGVLDAVGDALGGGGETTATEEATDAAAESDMAADLPWPWILGGVAALVLVVIAVLAMRKKK